MRDTAKRQGDGKVTGQDPAVAASGRLALAVPPVLLRAWLMWLGAAALVVPTLIQVAQEYWSTEEGSHGPIVLATGIWLLWCSREVVARVAIPGRVGLTYLFFGTSLLVYIFAAMVSMLWVECLAVYGALLSVLYFHTGWRSLRTLWFPLIYLAFMLPQPQTFMLPLTRALKTGLSSAAVALLSRFGFDVGHGGVVLYVDQYELLVASACSGVNSMIGLGAIGVFYVHVRHVGQWRAALPLLIAIIPVALLANFLRVVLLILITHYFGARVSQAYAHDAAGLLMFCVALATLFGLDAVINRPLESKPAR